MADGTTKPIEDLVVGDQVLATDPESGQTESRVVDATIIGEDAKQLVDVTIDVDGDDGDRTATVVATDNHPFWVADLHAWIDAGELSTGALLRTSAGTHVQVEAVRHRHAAHATVYNLTVQGVHTYYVLAGNTPVLVHNCGDESPLAAAERARDQAGLKPDGTPNRESPVYVGGYDAKGNVMGTGNGPRGSGVHAEDILQERMPGAQMTQPYAWRRNKGTGELEWRPHTVCPRCQGKYPSTLFPPGTRGESGGAWGG